jgi:hypothetical protein
MITNNKTYTPYIFKNPQDKMLFAHLFTSKLETCGTINQGILIMYFYVGDLDVAIYFKSVIGAGIINPVMVRGAIPIYFLYLLDMDSHKDALLWVSELIADKIRAPHMMNLFSTHIGPFIQSQVEFPDGGNSAVGSNWQESLANYYKNKQYPLEEITNEDISEAEIKKMCEDAKLMNYLKSK